MDIGYNAIRAVVYKDNTLGAPEIFNKKFKNNILNLLTNESIQIKHQTYLTIEYLLNIFKKLKVDNIQCVATAVLRNHPKATEFVEYIKNEYDLKINIISGEEEANFTALALTTSIKGINGIAADLGGGSLELITLNNGKLDNVKSFNLGTKIIGLQNITNEDKIIKILEKEYDNKTYENLYLLGGSLRFIAKLYLDSISYPLKNLHNLEIQTNNFLEYLEKLQLSCKIKNKGFSNNAVIAAKAIISIFKPKRLIISIYGLKEGVYFAKMIKSEQQKDIVLEKVKYTCNFDETKTNWQSYFDIIMKLLPKDEGIEIQRIIKLSVMLLPLQYRFDPNLYPTAISEFILSSEIPFNHKTRIMVALILSYSINHKTNYELLKISRKIINKQDINNCQIIGHFLCIAQILDGNVFTEPSFTIKMENNYLEIDSNEILPRSIFEQIRYRLKSIAFIRKLNFSIETYSK